MPGFDETTVAAAFDVAALPPGPLLLDLQSGSPKSCPACGDEYLPDCTPWLGQVCYPESMDHPVAGHSYDIPAWCATERRFLTSDEPEADR